MKHLFLHGNEEYFLSQKAPIIGAKKKNDFIGAAPLLVGESRCSKSRSCEKALDFSPRFHPYPSDASPSDLSDGRRQIRSLVAVLMASRPNDQGGSAWGVQAMVGDQLPW